MYLFYKIIQWEDWGPIDKVRCVWDYMETWKKIRLCRW